MSLALLCRAFAGRFVSSAEGRLPCFAAALVTAPF